MFAAALPSSQNCSTVNSALSTGALIPYMRSAIVIRIFNLLNQKKIFESGTPRARMGRGTGAAVEHARIHAAMLSNPKSSYSILLIVYTNLKQLHPKPYYHCLLHIN